MSSPGSNLVSIVMSGELDLITLKPLYGIQGIIEGEQIEVAAFSLESFAYLTGLVTTKNNAGSKSARARRLNDNTLL